RVIPLDLVNFGPGEPLRLLRWIFAGLGAPVPNIPERDSRDAFELCNALETELNRRQENWCLVFSRFADANLLLDTRDFIMHLAVQAEQRIQYLRVILLGYDRKLPIEIDEFVLKEEIALLTPDDFAECAAGVLNQRGVPVTPPEVRPG